MNYRKAYQFLVENLQEGIYIISQNGFEFVNGAFKDLTGFSAEECYAMGLDILQHVHPEDREFLLGRKKARKDGRPLSSLYRVRIYTKSGDLKHVEFLTSPLPGWDGAVIGIMKDVTAQKGLEESLRESEERHRSIVERAGDGISIIQDARFLYVNPQLANMLGFSVDELREASVPSIIPTPNEPLLAERYARRMNGETVIAEYETQLKRKDGLPLPVEIKACVISHQGRPAHLAVIRDVSRNRAAHERLRQTLTSLRKAMGGTIEALNKTVEMRDPYTAGHQKRVADLARSIAGELGLPRNQVEGVRMAGSIHDLGKVSIPAEILSKPGRISQAEFRLIQCHPQTAYDILKSIDFPWPVADIVHQHHERLDGTGYPLGLRGDDIMIEARILAVADVVEAMVSHRPYRSAMSLNQALDEIRDKRGTLYDPDAVMACTRLFREKHFDFKGNDTERRERNGAMV